MATVKPQSSTLVESDPSLAAAAMMMVVVESHGSFEYNADSDVLSLEPQ